MIKRYQSAHTVKSTATWLLISLYTSTCMVGSIATASSVLNNNVPLVPYSVVAGDTLFDISVRHGISVDTLRAINASSPQPLNGEHIRVGQVIYVPGVIAQVLPEFGSHKQAEDNRGSKEAFVANQALRIGKTYSQNTSADSRDESEKHGGARFSYNGSNDSPSASFVEQEKKYVEQQITSVFQNEINERASSLLGAFGTAKVDLGFDRDLHLTRYSADVLAPLFDTSERMFFVQGGGRFDDSSNRTIINLGIGQRHFFETWMLGYNGFFDYDATRHHSRLGMGGEAWADFLKLSANLYTPLSSWKDSRDFDEYLERAARGFDLNAKYYLPQYPQLGLSAKIEQYFGDEVDLLGSKKLERNPYAATLGFEWQPVPLFKVGIDHREVKGGQNDTQINVGIEWRLGSSLDDMLNSNKVVGSRQLQGMRHDLVERNNNIVLKYKEKPRSVNVEHAPIHGMSGDVITLNPVVNISKGDITAWRWSATNPLLQGALSDANVQSPTLTLPVLPPDVVIDNDFSLFLTVTDELGRTYQSAAIPVVVQIDPALLRHRLLVGDTDEQIIADSHTSPEAKVAISDTGSDIEFVLVRQLKDDHSSYVIEQPQEIVFEQLMGFHVEQLEGELRLLRPRSAGAGEKVWINKLRVTPRNPGQRLPMETLNLSAKGASGSTDSVYLILSTDNDIELKQEPRVSELRMAGKLEVGQVLTATYHFDANGGEPTDKSTYAWGNRGETADKVSSAKIVDREGQVPGVTLTQDDVGEVKEVSVQAKNGQAITGNILTVDSSMNLEEGNGTEGGNEGGTVLNPNSYTTEIRYRSTATLEANGVEGRPVAQRDIMTAYCQITGEAQFIQCDENRYTFRWFVLDGQGTKHLVEDVSTNTFMPRAEDQGKTVLVDVLLK